MGFLELSNTGALEYCNAIFFCVCVSCFYFSCFFAASVTGLFRYSMGYSGIPWDIQVSSPEKRQLEQSYATLSD